MRTDKISDVLSFVSQIEEYLSRQERNLSRSLLVDHVPCANSLARGLLGKCRYDSINSNNRNNIIIVMVFFTTYFLTNFLQEL